MNNIYNEVKIYKRKWYIFFSLISGSILIWSLIYGFTDIAHGVSNSSSNNTTIETYFHRWSWFMYFTNTSNIFFFLVTTVRIFYRKGFFKDQLQIAASVYMLLVGIIYWLALAPTIWKGAIDDGRTSMLSPDYFLIKYILNNILLHFVTVVLAVLLVFIGIKNRKYKFSQNFWKIIIYPIVYYIFAWFIYLSTDYFGSKGPAYIYGFLDFYHLYGVDQDIFITISMNIVSLVSILLTFMLIYYIVIKLLGRSATTKKQKNIKQTSESAKSQVVIKSKIQPINNDSKSQMIRKQKIKSKKKVITTPNKINIIEVNSKKISKSVPTKVKNISKHNVKVKYILQKSTKSSGWELKKVGAKRATIVKSTKAKVKEYYSKKLISSSGTTLIEKGRHGKIRQIKKKK